MTRKELETMVKEYGLQVDTWSPGDGVTRFRFAFSHDGGDCYFSFQHPLYTALGLGEANVWFSGFRAGRIDP